MKNLRLHNVSIHRNFYYNRFIDMNMLERKRKKSWNHGVTESLSHRRTYILKKMNLNYLSSLNYSIVKFYS